MEIIDQQQKQELFSALPVLPRLDRLDRVLQLLEKKHSQSRRLLSNEVSIQNADEQPSIDELEDPRKSLSSALEEVHHKGTLLERLALLENRVVQLSLEMDEGNTSRSSSSTTAVISDNKMEHDSVWSTITSVTAQENDHPAVQKGSAAESGVTGLDVRTSKRNKRAYKKYFGWFRMGC